MKRKKIKPMFTKQELDAIKRKVKREKSRINFRCPLCGNGVKMFPDCKIKEIFCAYRFDFALAYPKREYKEKWIIIKGPIKIFVGFGRTDWGAEPCKDYFIISWNKQTH